MKKIILMDMDGTITPARKPIEEKMKETLDSAISKGFEIGIVSGSTYQYIMEQIDTWFQKLSSSVHILPCNGTQYYRGGMEIYKNNMRKHIGDERFKQILQLLFMEQSNLIDGDFPFTGDHVSYRESMINYCPVGRNANDQERDAFSKWDRKTNYRHQFIKMVNDIYSFKELIFKIGGNTSIDIYPLGWDKSFCLSNFMNYDEIYFIGDRCGENGNDKEIYDEVYKTKSENSFWVHSTDETISIIKNLIKYEK